jgi:hypothetical protein
MQGLNIEHIDFRNPTDLYDWNNFVDNNNGSCFNYLEWQKILSKSYNAKPVNLMIKEKNNVIGIVCGYFTESNKFFFIKKGIFGSGAQFHNYLSNFLINDLGYKDQYSISFSIKTSVILDVIKGEESVWSELRRETRKDIKKGIKKNLFIGEGWDFLDQFYTVYVENMMQKNALIHSKKYFIQLSKNLGKKASLFVVIDGSEVISGIIVLYSKSIAELYIGAWNRKFANKSPYSFMYWHAITDAINKGIKMIDMGESTKGSGTYKYKVNFGGNPVNTEYASIEKKNSEIQANNRFARLFISNGLKLILSLKFFSKLKYFYLIRSRKNNKIV